MIKHEWFYPVKIKNCHLGAFRLAGKITSHLTTWWRFAPAWRVCCLNDKTKRQHLVVVRHIIHIGKLNYLEKKDSPNTSIFDHFRHIFLLLFCLLLNFSEHRSAIPTGIRACQIPVEGILGLAFPAMAANGALQGTRTKCGISRANHVRYDCWRGPLCQCEEKNGKAPTSWFMCYL